MKINTHLLRCISCSLGITLGSGFGAPPPGYYDSGNGLVGVPLKNALHEVIDDHTIIPYSRTDEVMRVIHQSAADESKIELIYSNFQMPASDIGASGKSVWNREHIWPRSFGIGNDGADNSDLHNLFPCNAEVNSARGNKFFDYSDPSSGSNSVSPENTSDGDSWEPGDEDKGKVARAILYGAVRYDGSDPQTEDLEVSEVPDSAKRRMGKLSTLLRWNHNFPPSADDTSRNDSLFIGVETTAGFLKQGNRNPFVDYPQLADAIFLAPQIFTFSKWQVQSFRIDSLNSRTVAGPLADPDQDGFANLLEFVGGGDPSDQQSRPFIELEPDGNEAIIRFRKIKNLELSSFKCSWEVSKDLKIWTELNMDSAQEVDEGKTTIQTLRIPRTAERTFCRLKVSAIEVD